MCAIITHKRLGCSTCRYYGGRATDKKSSQAFAGRRKDRVCNRRRDGRQWPFAEARRGIVAIDRMNIYPGNLAQLLRFLLVILSAPDLPPMLAWMI